MAGAHEQQNARPIQPDGRLHGVIVAVRRQDGRLLMIRRAWHLRAGGRVCFPGGVVELGELPELAAVREMREELGIDVKLLKCVWVWDAPSTPLKLFGWIAEWAGGEIRPDPREVADVLWLTPQEGTDHVDGLPTNRDFIAALAGPPGGELA
ncbi:MAG: NUDIX domain-containing protein [Tepidisphaeraceae bacterium]|jgi:8-oxo-dGTP pyrophosphatase MutT (NUDIX family)